MRTSKQNKIINRRTVELKNRLTLRSDSSTFLKGKHVVKSSMTYLADRLFNVGLKTLLHQGLSEHEPVT